MRLNIILTVLKKELREMLRDRRSLLVMFGLPLVLYPVLTLVITSLGISKQKEYTQELVRIAVVNLEDAPHLKEMIAGQAKDFVISPFTTQQDTKAALSKGNINAIITIPKLAAPGFERVMIQNPQAYLATTNTTQTTTQQSTPNPNDIVITVDRSHSDTPFVENRLAVFLGKYQQWIIETRLANHRVSATVLAPLTHHTVDIATGEQRLGKVLSLMLPLLLLMTGMLGAFFPALNSTTTERELGTLEALLISPATRMELLTAKTLLVLISGLLTALLNMLSMSMVLLQAFKLMSNAGAADLGINMVALGLTYLAAVPAILFFASLVMIVGLVARNFREANSFASPVMLLPICAIFVAMAEPPSTTALMLTPVVNTTLIIRDVLTHRANVLDFVLAFGSSCLYAGLMLSASVRLFSNEQLVNPSWEPLSLGFWRNRGTNKFKHGLPSVDTGLTVFCISLLLTMYVGVNLKNTSLLLSAFITQGGLIAGPALLMAAFAHYQWVETFKLRLPVQRTWQFLGLGLLLGCALVPVVHSIALGQQWLWPSDGQLEMQQAKRVYPALAANPFLISFVLSALAGITEELLYHGLLQTALLRRLPPIFAIGLVALLFALAHFDLHHAPERALLGALFGWMVYQTGSLLPAVLAHFAYDATALLYTAYHLISKGVGNVINGESGPSPELTSGLWWVCVVVGCGVIGYVIYFTSQNSSRKLMRGFPIIPN